MEREVDVLVIGAGPTGSTAAKYAARGGADVLLVEKRSEIGTPVRCGEGVAKRWLDEIGLAPSGEFICHEVEGARVIAPDGTALVVDETRAGNECGYVLERDLFDRYLAKEAAKAGAEILIKTSAVDLIALDRILAQYGAETGEIRASLKRAVATRINDVWPENASLHGEQDLQKMGGLRKHAPITFITLACASLAISGFPFTSGYFSKDEILWQAFSSPHGSWLFWLIGVITALMTSFYMFRLLFMTFFGERRGPVSDANEEPHSGTTPMDHPHRDQAPGVAIEFVPPRRPVLYRRVGGVEGLDGLQCRIDLADLTMTPYDLFISCADADRAWVEGYLIPELRLTRERVITRLRADPGTERMPVIVVSADANPRTRKAALTEGVTAFVQKPFGMKELYNLVEEVIADQ